MKLLITTQYKENYGTEENPYWKNKGGSSYIVSVPLDIWDITDFVNDTIAKVEYSNPMSTESVVGWELVSDDYQVEIPEWLPEYEREGYIKTYSPKELVFN